MDNLTEMSRQLDRHRRGSDAVRRIPVRRARGRRNNAKNAIRFAEKAVQYNPDYIDGWRSTERSRSLNKPSCEGDPAPDHHAPASEGWRS
jgi:hypothetical protein